MTNMDFGNLDLFYSKYYDLVLRAGFIGAAQNRTHAAMEKKWSKNVFFEKVLEVGAGTGDHRKFVKHGYKDYFETDIRFTGLPEIIETHPNRNEHNQRVIREFADVTHLDYRTSSFDRVVVTCLILHLEEPERALEEIRRVCKKDSGVISILVPCEPGLLLRFSRAILTSRKAKKLGFSGYNLFNARDHKNYLSSVDTIIDWVYRDDTIVCTRLPFRWPSWNFNLYYIYTITRGQNE